MNLISNFKKADARGYQDGFRNGAFPEERPIIYRNTILDWVYYAAYLRGMQDNWKNL